MVRVASLTLVIGAVLLLTWVLAPASARPHRAEGGSAAVTEPQAATVESVEQLAADTAKLRGRLVDLGPYSRPSRDPFRFGRDTNVRPRPMPAAPIVTAPPPPPLPRIVAILSDSVNGSMVRRAAIGSESGVRIVGVGDMVGSLRVTAISADGIELIDAATNATFRVPLR